MTHNVYTIERQGIPRNHVAIFIETEPDKSGKMFHVTGTVLMGMELQIEPAKWPEHDGLYVPGTQTLIGRIQRSDMPRFEDLCRSVPPPGAQLKLNGQPKDPSKPIRRCGDWILEVTDKAFTEGIVLQ